MKDFWKSFGIALLAGIAAALLFLPVFGRTAVRGIQTKNLSNATQWAFAVKAYANDHEGLFPMHLNELVPDYAPLSEPTDLLFEVREDSNGPSYAKEDWLYFGAFFDEKNLPPILIASPQATGFKGKPPKRIVVRGDGTGAIVTEEEYREKLRKTIEAMHKRFDGPASAPVPTLDTTERPRQ